MKITILTLFPEMFAGPFDHSIVKNAREKKLVEINFVNIRDFGEGRHKMVDDTEYGGGIGMVMKVDVLHRAIENVKVNPFGKLRTRALRGKYREKVVLLSATGKTYDQQKAQEYAELEHLILICGHYEGVDERIKDYIDEEISIGDFVLTGGEVPAMLITDSVSRLISGVLPVGAADDESFSEMDDQILLEYPHYTKPREYNGKHVPEILLSGNHPKVKEWRKAMAYKATEKSRPDLLKKRKS